jgi:hypothetical protein
MRGRCWSILATLFAVTAGTVALAQRAGVRRGETVAAKNGSTAAPGKRAGNPMAITPAREAAALTFAKLYHAELAHLLDGLKKRNRRAYRQAIRQLYLDSERLARVKDRDPKRYDLSLQIWKLDSRIRLLAARVLQVKDPDPKLEEQLKKALGERVDLRLRQMEMDRERMVQRLKKIDANIADLQTNRDKAIDQQLKRVKRSLGIRLRKAKGNRRKARARKAVKTKAKDANPGNP